MAITLRDGEQIVAEVNFHWSMFLIPKIFAVLGVPLVIFFVFVAVGSPADDNSVTILMPFFVAVIFFLPYVYRWLQNKCKSYVVTNQRLYVEEGVLSKTKNDIPLAKINDLVLKQGIFQRIVGAGDLSILTGNDKITVIRDIDEPDTFKNAVSEVLNKRERDT